MSKRETMRQITFRLYEEDEKKLKSLRHTLEDFGKRFSTAETIRCAIGIADRSAPAIVERILKKGEDDS